MKLDDKQIISSLIAHDPKVTAQFFFKECRPLFLSVIRRVFGTQIVDYDEIISEIYILLMENDCKKLRTFKFESTLYQWLKTVAIRHCLLLKSKAKVIDDESQEPLNNSRRELSLAESSQARMDMETIQTDEESTLCFSNSSADDRRQNAGRGSTAIMRDRGQPL